MDKKLFLELYDSDRIAKTLFKGATLNYSQCSSIETDEQWLKDSVLLGKFTTALFSVVNSAYEVQYASI